MCHIPINATAFTHTRYAKRDHIERIWLTMKARWFNNHVCINEEKCFHIIIQCNKMPME